MSLIPLKSGSAGPHNSSAGFDWLEGAHDTRAAVVWSWRHPALSHPQMEMRAADWPFSRLGALPAATLCFWLPIVYIVRNG